MSPSFRSGNSRLLAKTFDELGHPLAVLDRRGVVVFANAALCSMVKADATQLVGQQSSWQVAADDTPFAALLTAIAPPAGARRGQIVTRQLNAPIVFGSTATGQIFLPLLNGDGSVWSTLVVLGNWQEIVQQQPPIEQLSLDQRRRHEALLTEIRSRWQMLDGLYVLIGTSPAMQLALNRAQLTIQHPCHFLISGPEGAGKAELVRGIFAARLKKANLAKVAGQFFPVACELLEAELLDSMLDLFAGRFRLDSPRAARLLLLEHVDQLPEASVQRLNDWLDRHGDECWVAAVTELAPAELALRTAAWTKLVARISTVEISIPALRDRREDILPLVDHALAAVCHHKRRAPLTLTPDAFQLLTAFPWPGNANQLSQVLEEAVNHAVLSSAIAVNHLPMVIRSFVSTGQQEANGIQPVDLDQILLDVEKIILQRALKLSPRNRAQVARWLGISRPRLLRRIEQLGLDGPGSEDV